MISCISLLRLSYLIMIPLLCFINSVEATIPRVGLGAKQESQSIEVYPHDKIRTIIQGRRVRQYLEHLPPNYEKSSKLPVVIVLHGAFADYKNIARVTGMTQKGDAENFIVVYPNGTGHFKSLLSWNAGDCCGYSHKKQVDDIAFINALLDSLSTDPKVDTHRIYVAGFSNGAMLALLLGCNLSSRIAAISSVAGSMTGKESPPLDPLPVLMIHGTGDMHVPYNGGLGLFARLGYPVNKESVNYAVQFWARHNKCAPIPQTTKFSHVIIDKYLGKKNGEEVILCTIIGGGHSWPGGKKAKIYSNRPTTEISATDLIWDFFKTQARSKISQAAVASNSSKENHFFN